ncbi:MAG TPA: helix-turn-helix domain-containing protein [Candidatus Olsenella avicola]|nr:helix-turn-helix domain-containing protein [Candidatus Olsenella avicola]
MDEKNETLGRRIARLRLEYGMTQERLAMKMGVTAQAVSKWENDLSAPDIMLLPELARTLGVTVDELLEGRKSQEIALAEPAPEPAPEPSRTDGSKPKKLHIQVDSSDGDVVNINVPLGMASAVLGASSKLPGVVNLNLNDADVDMTLVAEAIKHGEKGTLIEVDGGDGDHVVISLE